VGKGKLARFADNDRFENVFQPSYEILINQQFEQKGNWNNNFFQNQNPITLEIGCGRGEYSVNLASKYPERNFIGVDIKGARLWAGAKFATNNNLKNVGFVRTRIEFTDSCFAKNEVDEIWITFPDPQLKDRFAKKRLTSSRFLNKYRNFLKKDGIVHLKTDSQELHEYTLQILKHNNLEIIEHTNNLYNSNLVSDILSIKTHYEELFSKQGKTITYIKFKIDSEKVIEEIPEEK